MGLFSRKPKPQSHEAEDISTPGGLPDPPPSSEEFRGVHRWTEKPPSWLSKIVTAAVLAVGMATVVSIIVWGISGRPETLVEPVRPSVSVVPSPTESVLSDGTSVVEMVDDQITAASLRAAVAEAEVQAYYCEHVPDPEWRTGFDKSGVDAGYTPEDMDLVAAELLSRC